MALELLIVVAVLGAVAYVIAGPLRRARSTGAEDAARSERDELEAAREAKYREIRDAELDYRTGKLSPEDWRELDAGLRAEAIEILRALDRNAGSDRTATGDRTAESDRTA